MLFYLAYKNIVSRKSSFVIILFIAFAISLMVLVNSIFDSTENGIESVYSKSFTGDIVIRPDAKIPLSLFGDETPVTGKLTEIPRLIPYMDIVNYVKDHPDVSGFVPQISGRAVVESDDSDKELETLFGVEASEYFKLMTSIKVLEGTPYNPGERGIALSKQVAERYGVKTGDELQFLVEDKMTFRIRAAKVSCIYDYEIKNETLDTIILVDPFTMRSLLDMTDTSENIIIDENNQDLLTDDDFDSLFEDAEDFEAEEIQTEEKKEAVESVVIQPEETESTAWNFLILQLKNRNEIKKTVAELNRYFKKSSWPVQAVNWRSAAGSTAMYLFWIRFIFNVGVIVVLCAGFIVINNTLVVNVLNRTQEIGTMRAEGASRKFVSAECMTETFMLTITAGILGCIIGAIASTCISSLHLNLGNSFLIQLFGNETLEFSVSFMTIVESMILSFILGIVGWIYPVHTALKVSPVKAMQGGS
ncbi:ABC transporter permease [Treponema sp.]|uniref:ABC transporter permease n=1 Tax=Treponema sp. TaxID=166 RepID=UPI00298E0CBC|nr:FtsX-like permease family protein [Treponema sp.]MCQ2241053.1 FtsX-like permease family protein [Treponema sp.]